MLTYLNEKKVTAKNSFKKLQARCLYFLHLFLLNLVLVDRVSASKTINSLTCKQLGTILTRIKRWHILQLLILKSFLENLT